MVHITQEELTRLARACRLRIAGNDAQTRVVAKLEAVLSYASQLSSVPTMPDLPSAEQLVLVVRPDTVLPSPADVMMRQAPAQRERYFVVPVVIGAEGNT